MVTLTTPHLSVNPFEMKETETQIEARDEDYHPDDFRPDDYYPDEFQPTPEPDYNPSLEDDMEWLAILVEMDDRDEILTEWADRDRADDMEAAFNPWDRVERAELIEGGCLR